MHASPELLPPPVSPYTPSPDHADAPAVNAGAEMSMPQCNALEWRVEYRVLTLLEHDGPVASTHPQRVTTGFSFGL